jgi:uncharacterized protein YdeI (YjbR/CyaY-like superfamily)
VGLKPTFFATPAAFRRWLSKHHESATELWVGFHKKGTGTPSITWPESVAQALCFGWIDGVRKRIDDERYMIRFSPRKPRSIWSNVNVAKARELIELRLMHPAGLAAFEKRSDARTGVYSAEQKNVSLGAAYERALRANANAWEFFKTQPPWYRRTVTWWVISAKKEETRQRRLAQLIADSAAGEWIGPIRQVRKPGPRKAPARKAPVRKKPRRGSA